MMLAEIQYKNLSEKVFRSQDNHLVPVGYQHEEDRMGGAVRHLLYMFKKKIAIVV
jgi:hypothetical protein